VPKWTRVRFTPIAQVPNQHHHNYQRQTTEQQEKVQMQNRVHGRARKNERQDQVQ
jgi:hypothetical protein